MFMAVLVAAAVVLIAAGLLWQKRCHSADHLRYPAPGSTADGLHVVCNGEGAPVILEAGIAASSVGWTIVQRELSHFCRVCSYDRPGFGWSPWRGGTARHPDNLIADLHKVVLRADQPVVLVGHSFGGLLVRVYAAQHLPLVRGLVLVDPALTHQWAEPTPERLRMLSRGVSLSRRGAMLARIGFVRLALSLLQRGSTGGAKAFAKAASGRASVVTERIAGQIRKLPPELWPVVQSQWCRPDSFVSMAQHLEVLPQVARAARDANLPSTLPVIVISGSHLREEELAEHRELSRGRHVIAEGSGHWVHLDRPDLITQAVRELLHG